MIEASTLNHFNKIAPTWEQKGWVRSKTFNRTLASFIRNSERSAGLQHKKYKSSLYFGIGTGVLFEHLNKYNLAGVDEAANMLGRCPEGIIQILSKVEELPFLMNDQFNMTFSRNLLKHCVEPMRAIESMFKKLRPGGVAIITESVALHATDTLIPSALVRITDPSHPPFLTAREIITLCEKAGFSGIEAKIVSYRDRWFKKWLVAEQATPDAAEQAWNLYELAPRVFKKRHNVVMREGDITSTVPWLFLRARKG